MIRPLRWLLDLHRSYFLALSAFVAAAAASIYLLVAPVYRGVRSLPGEEGTEEFTGTLIEVNGAAIIGVLIVPLLITAAPLLSLPRKTRPSQRSHRLNSLLAVAMFMAFIAVTVLSVGVFYVPALILAVASSASLFFGRDRRTGAADTRTQAQRNRAERREEARQSRQPRMSGKRRRKKAR